MMCEHTLERCSLLIDARQSSPPPPPPPPPAPSPPPPLPSAMVPAVGCAAYWAPPRTCNGVVRERHVTWNGRDTHTRDGGGWRVRHGARRWRRRDAPTHGRRSQAPRQHNSHALHSEVLAVDGRGVRGGASARPGAARVCVPKRVGFEHSRRACWARSQTPPPALVRSARRACVAEIAPPRWLAQQPRRGGSPQLKNEASDGHGVAGARHGPSCHTACARGFCLKGSPGFRSSRRLFGGSLSLSLASAQLHYQLVTCCSGRFTDGARAVRQFCAQLKFFRTAELSAPMND